MNQDCEEIHRFVAPHAESELAGLRYQGPKGVYRGFAAIPNGRISKERKIIVRDAVH